MKPIDFPQANKNLLKPEGWTDEQCGSLPVFTDGTQCISCWQPTWKERVAILLFGKMWLYVWSGQTQPPVALDGSRTVFNDPK